MRLNFMFKSIARRPVIESTVVASQDTLDLTAMDCWSRVSVVQIEASSQDWMALNGLKDIGNTFDASAYIPNWILNDGSKPTDVISAAIERACPTSNVPVDTSRFSAIAKSSPTDRMDALRRTDAAVASHLQHLLSVTAGKPLMVFVALTSDITPLLVKRSQPSAANLSIPYSRRSIMQKYQFFNPGLFMGISSALILLVILLAAVRIMTNLQTPTKFETSKKDK